MSGTNSLRSTVVKHDVYPVGIDAPVFAPISDFRPSPWCDSFAKRLLDLLVSTVVLLCVAPLFPIIALLIKLTSPGPAVFIHDRVGRNGKHFRMYKFRSMEHQEQSPGGVLTREGDRRITPLGRHLRRWKLDELPQLINVIRGDISLIGPRPHMTRLLGNSPELKYFLSLRPGVTGLATMLFRHEESTLPKLPAVQLEAYYIENVLPEKIRLELQYAEDASFWTDLLILARTVQQILTRNERGDVAVVTSKKILARPHVPKQPSRRFGPVGWTSLALLALLAWMWVGTLGTSDGAAVTASTGNRIEGRGSAESSRGEFKSEIVAFVREKLGAKPNDEAAQQAEQRSEQEESLRVWVDLSTGLYYCPGSDMYGKTRKGHFITERDALLQHFESALRHPCGQLEAP